MQRPSPSFGSQQFCLCNICRETFYPNLYRFVWRRHAGDHLDGHNMATGNQEKHLSLSFFSYLFVNLFLEELKSIKIILFLIQELFR